MTFIIQEYRKDLKLTWYVAARPGYCRTSKGTYIRDGSLNGGPEWTTNRDHAFEFASHRAAARVQSRCPGARIIPAETQYMPR